MNICGQFDEEMGEFNGEMQLFGFQTLGNDENFIYFCTAETTFGM